MIRTFAVAAVVLTPALASAAAHAQAYNPGENAASSQTPEAVFARPAEAGDAVRFTGNHAFRAMNCRGGDAVISGDANQLKLTDCSRLTLTGERNRVSVVLSSPGDIKVTGARNVVRYRAPDDGPPRITDTGVADDIRPMAG